MFRLVADTEQLRRPPAPGIANRRSGRRPCTSPAPAPTAERTVRQPSSHLPHVSLLKDSFQHAGQRSHRRL